MAKRLVAAAFAAVLVSILQVGGAAAETLLERGRYLMSAISACGNCHTPRGPDGQLIAGRELAGGMEFRDEMFVARAANLTPDPETGIGRWSDAQIARAIREGIRPDGRVIGPPMPIDLYRGIADRDLRAIIAYLRQVPAVHNEVARSEYHMPLPANYGPPVRRVAAPTRDNPVRYGAYLAGPVGHCIECHTPMVGGRPDFANRVGAGGQPFNGPWGVSVARNLTPHESGLRGWSDVEIARAIREGVSRDGTHLKPPMAFDFYRNINNADMRALTAYLRSLRPLPLGGTGS
jgi:mono/diheme cytochrome c family protein